MGLGDLSDNIRNEEVFISTKDTSKGTKRSQRVLFISLSEDREQTTRPEASLVRLLLRIFGRVTGVVCVVGFDF